MSDIFISYAREKLATVEPLAKALEAQGWSVWWDPQILPGMAFDNVIEEAIDSARCVIVVWSSESVSSNWVRSEAGEGAERNILIPVLIEEVRVPLAFRRIQAVRLIDWDGSSSHADFNQLVRAVSKLLEKGLRKKQSRAPRVTKSDRVGFEVGDIIEQYRHFDGRRFVDGAFLGYEGTKWKVLAITDGTIEVELVEGRMYWDGEINDNYEGPGFLSWFSSSSSAEYQRKFPRKKIGQQLFDEFRKVNQ